MKTPDDNPEFDGTDGAHPAWWRGHDAGCRGIAMRWKEALEAPPGPGVMQPEFQTLADQTHSLRERLAAALRVLRAHSILTGGGGSPYPLSWASAGGPGECPHGFAKGIPCRACDLILVQSCG